MGDQAPNSLQQDAADASALKAQEPDDLKRATDLFAKGSYEAIRNYLSMHGFSREEAEDLTQETFLRALRSRETYRSESSSKTWLVMIARHVALNALRHRNAAKRGGGNTTTISDRELSSIPEIAPNPEERVLGAEIAESMRKTIEAMPPGMRIAALYMIRGMKVDEIAKILQVSPGTIKSQLFRAREVLRRAMDAFKEG